ncbi:MAG: flagellar motor switch protein FliN [Desulfovibrionales bacterium]
MAEQNKDKDEQDKLAEEWEASLSAGDSSESDVEAEMDDEALAAEWADALASEEEEKLEEEKKGTFSAESQKATFVDMTEEARSQQPTGTKREMEFILDIPLEVSAELGRTKLLINELLQLGQGSVIELNKLAGEPLEIHVNGKLVARGEAVVINEKFGIRLTDIISPIERVKQLG